MFSTAGLAPDRLAVISRIARAALDAADPRLAVQKALSVDGSRAMIGGQQIDLGAFHRIRVVGIGKAAVGMASGLLDTLGERVTDGLLIAKHPGKPGALPERIRVLVGGHPLPTREGLRSAQELEHFLAGGRETDLVFCLISGGGSALMALPVEGVSFEDYQEFTRLGLACGATIGEMNTVRKHIDRLKGGGLARLVSPAKLVTLILSDVIGSPLDVIASGPTVADISTYADALAVFRKYGIESQVPQAILNHLERGARGDIAETAKPGDSALAGVINHLVASNQQAAQAAVSRASAEGFHTSLLTTYLQGEAAQAGLVLAGLLKQIDASGQPVPRPACLIAGGETTVVLRGSGLGGRSQELALGAAGLLAGVPDSALLALGTDGEDGPTDAAGALATGDTVERARVLGLDPQAYLQNNDAYHFFDALGDLVKTGPTGTNVNDLVFLFAF